MRSRRFRETLLPDCGLSPSHIKDIRWAIGWSYKKLTREECNRFRHWLRWKHGPECAYCHRQYAEGYKLTIDHIQPLSLGGAARDVRNMVLACLDCNRAKGNQWINR